MINFTIVPVGYLWGILEGHNVYSLRSFLYVVLGYFIKTKESINW